MNTTLVIMAAGMGSRYGGLKQLEPVGPHGETIIDYSVYDAAKAGFDHIVFIIREEIVPDFETFLKDRYPKEVKVTLALQENPAGINPRQTKPWGTAHAVLAVKNSINSPFAILNADDFYGRNAFIQAYEFLNQKDLDKNTQAIIGYRLADTLSPHGSVSRGICDVDNQNRLIAIREILNIEKSGNNEIYFRDEFDKIQNLSPNTLVSMNFWCFQPSIFKDLSARFSDFLKINKNSLKAEYLIPEVVNQLIVENKIAVVLKPTKGPWYGITYKQDKPSVQQAVSAFSNSGIYPSPLWK